MRKFITSILILLSIAAVVVFIIFVINMGSRNTPSQQPQNVTKAKDLSVLKISSLGKSVSGGITYDKYAFKTKGDNVVEFGTKSHSPVTSKQSIINSLIKIAKASDDASSPYFKADKWNGESNFSLTFNDAGNFNVTVNNGETVSEDSDYKFEFAPVDVKQGFNDEGGLDMSVTLKKAPSSNQLFFSYDSQSVRAFLQPSLIKEWAIGQDLGDGRTVASVTDTDVYDNKGNLVAHRPDYVVNAVAFYGNPNQVNDTVGGKQYKTGEIGMLYRMKVADSSPTPKTTWADWSLSGSTLSLTIPSDFLTSAVYPINLVPAGDTFGYTTAGSSQYSTYGPFYLSGFYPFPSSTSNPGTATSISMYGNYYNGTPCNVDFAVYSDGGTSNYLINSGTGSVAAPSSAGWFSASTGTAAIVAGTTYDLVLNQDAGWLYMNYNFVSDYYMEYSSLSTAFGTWPSTITWTSRAEQSNKESSIYITYTPSTVNFSGGINLSGGICVGSGLCNFPFTCGNNVSFTYNGSGVTYGTVSHNNQCWMDRNLGASEVATSYNDSNAYGDLFQWGRLDDGHQIRTSGITTTLSSTDVPGNSNFIYGMDYPWDWRSPSNPSLWQEVLGSNNPCPSGWRIPTHTEWATEVSSWSQNNYNGAYASPLKLTAGGARDLSLGTIFDVDNVGYYWSSTMNYPNPWGMDAHSSFAGTGTGDIAFGFSVRCILN